MNGHEIVEMIKEHANSGASLSLSPVGVKELNAVIGWHLIKDEPAPLGTDVIVCDRDGDCAVAQYGLGVWDISNAGTSYDMAEPTLQLGEIIAWMRLPKRPAGSP